MRGPLQQQLHGPPDDRPMGHRGAGQHDDLPHGLRPRQPDDAGVAGQLERAAAAVDSGAAAAKLDEWVAATNR